VLAHVFIEVDLEVLVLLQTVVEDGLDFLTLIRVRKVLHYHLNPLLEDDDQRIDQFHSALECLWTEMDPFEEKESVSKANRVLLDMIQDNVSDPQYYILATTPRNR
jgi:hypothetical protein